MVTGVLTGVLTGSRTDVLTGVLTGILTGARTGVLTGDVPRLLRSQPPTPHPYMKVRPWLLCQAPLVPAPGLPLSRVLTPLLPGRDISGVASQGFLHHGP